MSIFEHIQPLSVPSNPYQAPSYNPKTAEDADRALDFYGKYPYLYCNEATRNTRIQVQLANAHCNLLGYTPVDLRVSIVQAPSILSFLNIEPGVIGQSRVYCPSMSNDDPEIYLTAFQNEQTEGILLLRGLCYCTQSTYEAFSPDSMMVEQSRLKRFIDTKYEYLVNSDFPHWHQDIAEGGFQVSDWDTYTSDF